MKFPYDNADFYSLITEGYFYADRTDRIPLIEEAGKPLLFLRPPRFGKSLLLSMLENYYDVKKADEFEKIFGHLAIGQNPTPLANQYLVMKWDFSQVNAEGDFLAIKASLYNYVNHRIQDFADRYQEFLPNPIKINPQDAISSFQSVFVGLIGCPYKLYVLIDEYDHFAKTLMMSSQSDSEERYEDLRRAQEILKTLFKVIKSGMSGMGIDRVFITGVLPIEMSDITSGFNIAISTFFYPEFNDLCGFGSAEISAVMQQVGQSRKQTPEEIAHALATVEEFYDGYCFTYYDYSKVYNPSSLLYFLNHWHKHSQLPQEMLDDKLAMDSAILSYISSLSRGRELLLTALSESPPVSLFNLQTRFDFKDMLRREKYERTMAGLLYYFGLLTLGEGRNQYGKLLLKIPNLVVQRLYVQSLSEM